ncbi:MAG: hypothetical protein HQK89_01255 [Nitrospirae bacterium]|nr:hypothetical protein [Nitrospirota bacterium]
MEPTGVALDGSGNIYVVDRANNRIQKFTTDARYITQWGGNGKDNGSFDHPSGIGIDSKDNVYIVDQCNYRIQKFDSNGGYITKWGGSKDTGTTGNNEFNFLNHPPCSNSDNIMINTIGIDKDNNLYIPDLANNRIKKFSADGGYIATLYPLDQQDNPVFRYPTATAVDGNGNVYAVDSWNQYIRILNQQGKLIDSWGAPISQGGVFMNPAGIAFDHTGSVFVTDKDNSNIQKFTPQGILLSRWTASGASTGMFAFQSTDATYEVKGGITAGKDGKVYVADRGNNRIQIFDAGGKFIAAWGKLGYEGEKTGDIPTFHYPVGVALDQRDSSNVYSYVADSWNHRIVKLDKNGKFYASWGNSSTNAKVINLNDPSAVAVDNIGNVYVADKGNNRIVKFDSNGNTLDKWGKSDNTTGKGNKEFDHPMGVAIDSSNNVYVADTNNSRIQKFFPDGTFITTWGSYGDVGPNKFKFPSGIAVDSNNYVYVTDMDNHNVQIFTSDGTQFLSMFGTPGSGGGQFNEPFGITVDSKGNCYVVDSINQRVEIFRQLGIDRKKQAIIIAGGPANSGDIASEVMFNTAYAYNSLKNQGFSDADISIFDVNKYTGDDNDLKNQVKSRFDSASGSDDLIVYIASHGDNGNIILKNQIKISATELNDWLNTLQTNKTNSTVVFIYDACQSKSVANVVASGTNYNRLIINSAEEDKVANYDGRGLVSFSYFFWSEVYNGQSIHTSYVNARDAIRGATDNQQQAACTNDCTTATYAIGNGTSSGDVAPTIGSISSSQVLQSQAPAFIKAKNVTSSSGIARVWALLYPTDLVTTGNVPVTDLPYFDLTQITNTNFDYAGTYDKLNSKSNYNITVYAMDGKGNISKVDQNSSMTIKRPGTDSSSPKVTLKANGSSGTVSLKTSDTLSLKVSIDQGAFKNTNVSIQLFALVSNGLYIYVPQQGGFTGDSNAVTYSGPIFTLPETEVLRTSGLPSGNYFVGILLGVTNGSSVDYYADNVSINVQN